MKKEYELILRTVLKNKSAQEIQDIDSLLEQNIDWCEVGGQLLNHRLTGYFYYGLSKEQRQRIPKEMKKALKVFGEFQKKSMYQKYDEFMRVSEKLDEAGVRYCALKGLVFSADFYDFSERRSNDLDIMVLEDDLDKLDVEMRKLGYLQSLMPDGQLVEATKKEKLIQRMNYHDLVPYMSIVDGNEMEIDINFKFDDDSNIDHEIYEHGTQIYEKGNYKVKGLPFDTHLLFLCIHFFREGTNTLWTSAKRDVLLYKIVDIVNWIRVHEDEFWVEKWCEMAKKYNLQKQCFYTMAILSPFYDNTKINQAKELLRPEDISFMKNIFVEGENRYIERANSFVEDSFNWKC